MTKLELIQTIDVEPLFEKIREYLQIQELEFDLQRDEKRLCLHYGAIIPREKLGVMAVGFKEVEVGNFANAATLDENEEPYYWTNVHFSWSLMSGGSNGCSTMLKAKYLKVDGKYEWEFIISQPR